MTETVTKANLESPDGFYADLIAAHEGLTKAESDAYNAPAYSLDGQQDRKPGRAQTLAGGGAAQVIATACTA